MGSTKITVKQSAAQSIAAIAWYIESKGMIATADKFTDSVYDYFIKLADAKRSYALCRDPQRAALGYKCVPYKKKYTIAFIETEAGIIICEFTPTKLIHW
jgi:plasmid stabilization system protein ParE